MRRVAKGFGRTAATGAVALGAVAALVVSPPATAQPGPAARPGPTAPAQATGAPDSAEGFATSRASMVSVAPTLGNLAFAFTAGIAGAETTGGLAQGLASPLDLGLIGTSLTGEGCDGGDPAVQPEDLPQPVRADNRSGPAEAEATYLPIAGSDVGGGVSRVTATMQPSSQATTITSRIGLPPVLSVEGGEAITDTRILDDGTREAVATVELSLVVADVVRLDGMQWTGVHRSGGPTGESVAEGSFEVGTLSLLGQPLPLGRPDVSIDVVNTVLGALGFRLDLPEVERIEEPVDLLRVTPMRLTVADSPLGELAARPALELTREARSDLFDAVEEAYCGGSSLLLLGEIGLGVVAGTGSVFAELGGVDVRSGEVQYEDLFGQILPAAPAPPAVPEAPAPEAGVPATGAPPATSAPDPERADLDQAASPVLIAGPAERRCESTHAFGWPPCSTGAALPVGLIGAVATAGVATLDLRRRRLLLTEVAP